MSSPPTNGAVLASASAPAKLILCGEHAVVYNRPAIALPLANVRAHVRLAAGEPTTGVEFHAHDLGRHWLLDSLPDDPLGALVMDVLGALNVAHMPDLQIHITSDIPVASGMGSGAAVATALVRALADLCGVTLATEQVAALVYRSEQRLHGTPSGIDNAVVAGEQPIWFQRQTAAAPIIEPITIAAPCTLLIGDTGTRSATRLPVGAVRERHAADPAGYDAWFDQVGALVAHARALLARGQIAALGPLLHRNHALLQQIGVSSPELDRLVAAAEAAGALGAKLSGAGWGGVMLALVEPRTQARVAEALRAAGATQVLVARVGD